MRTRWVGGWRRVAGVLAVLGAGVPSVAQDVPLLDAEELGEFLDPLLERALREEGIPGAAIALVQYGEVVLARGYGVADRDSGAPVDPETTVFRIGSVSKAVTGVALTVLVDRGRLSLEDDVNTHLESLAVDARFPEPVRVHHLLTHTAGFDQIGRRRTYFDLEDPRTEVLRQFQSPLDRSLRPSLAEFLGTELVRVRPPGEVACYDTYGVTLAGLLVEEVSGRPFAAFLREELFEPLGMTRTFVEFPEERRDELATGYGLQEGRPVPLPYEYYATTPASSVDSTVVDMAQLAIALLEGGENEHGRVLSKEGTRALVTPQYAPRPGFPGFTHLFFEEYRNGQRALEHGGTMLGYSTRLYLLPDSGIGFFLACNRDSETGPPVRLHERVTGALLDRWFPEEEEEQEGDGAESPEPLPVDTERFAGMYADLLYCHTCPEGEGWSRSYHPVRAVAPGVLEFHGQRWIAVEPLVFQREDGGARAFFREDARDVITHRFDSPSAAAVSEKLGEHLLDEALGAGWRERPAEPLEAMTLRALERFEEAAQAYEEIMARRPDDGIACYYAGFCRLRQGAAAQALPLLERAFALERWPDQTATLLAAAHAAAGDPDAAFSWIQRALQHGAGAAELSAEPALAPLLREERVQALLHR